MGCIQCMCVAVIFTRHYHHPHHSSAAAAAAATEPITCCYQSHSACNAGTLLSVPTCSCAAPSCCNYISPSAPPSETSETHFSGNQQLLTSHKVMTSHHTILHVIRNVRPVWLEAIFNSSSSNWHSTIYTTKHTHTAILQPSVQDYPGGLVNIRSHLKRVVGVLSSFWILWGMGKIIEASAPTIRLDATSSESLMPPPPSTPNFTPDALPAATLPIYPGLGYLGTKYAGLHTWRLDSTTDY